MKLREFKHLLKQHSEKPFRLILPDGGPVPVSFHITEVGRVQKTFLDCGGTLRKAETCQLQIWVGEDEDHRLAACKAAAILEKARDFLPDDGIPVEVEYEDSVISQYEIAGHDLTNEAVVLRLAGKHTDCLAKELCGVPSKETQNGTAPDEAGGCCAKSGCCA